MFKCIDFYSWGLYNSVVVECSGIMLFIEIYGNLVRRIYFDESLNLFELLVFLKNLRWISKGEYKKKKLDLSILERWL